jgi:hypothetical protein
MIIRWEKKSVGQEEEEEGRQDDCSSSTIEERLHFLDAIFFFVRTRVDIIFGG